MMEQKIEKELEGVRKSLEIEVEQGTFPDVDLDKVVESLRKGIYEAENDLGITYDDFLKEIEREFLQGVSIRGGVNE